jgi:catechol 2,3-dioxygenase-like lactoylglutathione lyase family enzyme
MSHVRRFDHVGITVADLDIVTAFFVTLGLEVAWRMAYVRGPEGIIVSLAERIG